MTNSKKKAAVKTAKKKTSTITKTVKKAAKKAAAKLPTKKAKPAKKVVKKVVKKSVVAEATVQTVSPVKFAHLRDPRNPKRVLTIATTKTQENGADVLNVGFAVNFITNDSDVTWLKSQGSNDVYDRKLGNKIAAGRVEKTPIRIELNGRHPMDAIRALFRDLDREVLENAQIPYRAKQIVELDGKAYAARNR